MNELENIGPDSAKETLMMECKYCKNQINSRALKCEKCGVWLNKTRLIHSSAVTLPLLIALFSVISLSYKSVFDFYMEHMTEKLVNLQLSILDSGTHNLNVIAMNKGTADAFLERVRVNVKATYENELGELKNKNTKNYSYIPIASNNNLLSSIVPAGEYRLIQLTRAIDKHQNGSKNKSYKNEKVIITLTPDIINLISMEKAKLIQPIILGHGIISTTAYSETYNYDNGIEGGDNGLNSRTSTTARLAPIEIIEIHELSTVLECGFLYADNINPLCKRFSGM